MADDMERFITEWRASSGSERANSQPFLVDLCRLLELPPPEKANQFTETTYGFERKVIFKHGDGTKSSGFIDFYKRGAFVLESKQAQEDAVQQVFLPGVGSKAGIKRGTGAWKTAMVRAKNQAESYARALPASEGRPPFLIVADVGHCFELYSEFTLTGATYTPFPDPKNHRIQIEALQDPTVRELLRTVWLDPMSLDPSRRQAEVTLSVAASLARLAKSLEIEHAPEVVSAFLMRCLFTMFAEDVGLLPKGCFSSLLGVLLEKPSGFVPTCEELWTKMNSGGFCVALQEEVIHFNGGLFKEAKALPLNRNQLVMLLEAAKANWRDVEPAIFGTLLEQALDPKVRHKLGAHYTPRAYVERLVLPTVIEPLREEWNGVQAAATLLFHQGKQLEAWEAVKDFHKRLTQIRVLDPACGTGNFLYVSLEHLKRLEAEVLDYESDLGREGLSQAFLAEMKNLTVDPRQLLGLELNPRATAIAELVLWIGYLQWHFRTKGDVQPPVPVIQNFGNIQWHDALINHGGLEPVIGKDGSPLMRWDGMSTKVNPATGKPLPDETKQAPVMRFKDPKPFQWPEADYIVGNPPFLGGKDKRDGFGEAYFEAIHKAYPKVPKSADFVMFWWYKAALAAHDGKLRRFGFITTNSMTQTFNRRVVEPFLADAKHPVSIVYAVPDHPWKDDSGAADVRISMTVGEAGHSDGRLCRVTAEKPGEHGEVSVELLEYFGRINPDLSIGADLTIAEGLKANENLSCPGVKLHGAGFIVTPEQAAILGLGKRPGLEKHIRPYVNGRDLTANSRGVMVIDCFGLSENEVRDRYPEVYEWLHDRVKPDRDANASKTKDAAGYAKKWWLFGKPRETFRPALAGLSRYIATVETAKHRVFQFLDAAILPDNMLVNVASEDAYNLGVLSSRFHGLWAVEAGGRLGVGHTPRYNKTRCFETFPFPPTPAPGFKARIRDLAERIDAHRKERLAMFPELTLTKLYNVLESLREERDLTEEERDIKEKGLVGLLLEFHEDLDDAVAEAYGWPAGLEEQEVLSRLLALNQERLVEEAQGLIRWLRPEYQAPQAPRTVQLPSGLVAMPAKVKKAIIPWPNTLPEQATAVAAVLAAQSKPVNAEQIAKAFKRAKRERVAELLETLASLGQVRRLEEGRYSVA
ncbi:MAG: class I SAM-dependent DNA methyltransferase [Desulfovibrio sp.]|nr:class I SAM-dependent DNA methyltransferase [Desulfovibrio sp.]MBI4960400.1 class I SAM-dependent DNA methyltransferase [Desulfovibrio sp.]